MEKEFKLDEKRYSAGKHYAYKQKDIKEFIKIIDAIIDTKLSNRRKREKLRELAGPKLITK